MLMGWVPFANESRPRGSSLGLIPVPPCLFGHQRPPEGCDPAEESADGHFERGAGVASRFGNALARAERVLHEADRGGERGGADEVRKAGIMRRLADSGRDSKPLLGDFRQPLELTRPAS